MSQTDTAANTALETLKNGNFSVKQITDFVTNLSVTVEGANSDTTHFLYSGRTPDQYSNAAAIVVKLKDVGGGVDVTRTVRGAVLVNNVFQKALIDAITADNYPGKLFADLTDTNEKQSMLREFFKLLHGKDGITPDASRFANNVDSLY